MKMEGKTRARAQREWEGSLLACGGPGGDGYGTGMDWRDCDGSDGGRDKRDELKEPKNE